MHMVTVVGARPQFVKAAALSRRLKDARFSAIRESIIHTGQHYDHAMSGRFFIELEMPEPVVNLGVGSGSHGAQTGAIMVGLEQALADLKPDLLLVYGDTNSTLAAALTAAKLGLPLAHVEAGLRSFRRAMPEEVNRVVTDRLSDYLFCPSLPAAQQLAREGIEKNVHVVGDIMFDSFLHQRGKGGGDVLKRLDLEPHGFALATLHRAENTDDPARLRSLIEGLTLVSRDLPVLLPLHPRTAKAITALDLAKPEDLHLVEPLSYAETVALLGAAAVVATDSGGLQKEAYFASCPCVTLREETEWTETLAEGWNRLAPAGSAEAIARAIMDAREQRPSAAPAPVYGDGDAAGKILAILERAGK